MYKWTHSRHCMFQVWGRQYKCDCHVKEAKRLQARIKELEAELADVKANPLYDNRIALHQAYMDRGRRIEELHNRWFDDVRTLQARIEELEAALQKITEMGRVCENFELCTHDSCADSCGAVLIALEALKGKEEK